VNLVPTVLLVDDDRFMRELLKRAFSEVGIALQMFASALDLLASADLSSADLLLLDVRLPGMSGLELQLHLLERNVDLPVIFLTGSSGIPIAVEAMRNGAVDFLEKPFDMALLISRVRRTLGRRDKTTRFAPDRDFARLLENLTPREREVLDLMVTGKTSKRIARDLGGSFRTIEIHRARVMTKMGAANLADLVRMHIGANGNA
jgi:two-component system, LuxR family, response regulator FixJ